MTLDNAFEIELLKLCVKRVEHFTDQIMNKDAIPTHSDYMYVAGQLNALRIIVPDMCADARTILAER